MTQFDLLKRPRRNRKSPAIRSLVRESFLRPSDFVVPFFLIPGENRREPIAALPGIDRVTIDLFIREAELLHSQGIPAVAPFPVIDPSLKDLEGSEAWNEEGLLQEAIRRIKAELPSLCVIADVALDPFTTHSHDGWVNAEGYVENDLTLSALCKVGLSLTRAGCDILAPSDMMDGRIKALRDSLDAEGFTEASLLSYAVKYASSFYGPFRSAVQTKLAFGDKRGYQMDPANSREAIREVLLDEEEGADMVMVKPALPYLDVLTKVREATTLPVGAYHVGGEYAMIMAAAEKGWLNGKEALYESLTGIKRAGADFIFSYATAQISEFL